MSEPVTPPPPVPPSSNRPVISLVLGIIGLVCCPIAAPIAWVVGKQELAAITSGRSPASGEGLARAGMIIGIVGTALLAFGLLWVFFFGGIGVLQAFSQM